MTTRLGTRYRPVSPAPESTRRRRGRPPGAAASRVAENALRNGGGFDISVERAIPATTSIMRGKAIHVPRDNVHEHVSYIPWCGKRYKFTLEFPLDRPKAQMSAEEIKALDQAIEDHRNLFLLDLRANKGENIKPGDSFNFIFTDEGYTAYIPGNGKEFDPDRDTIDDRIKDGYITQPVRRQDEIARALSEGMQCKSAGELRQKLQADERLKGLQNKPKEREPAAAEPPAQIEGLRGLPNFGNSCHLNAAFQQLATNPILKKKLTENPGLLKGGSKNALFQAMKAYEKGNEQELEQALRRLQLDTGLSDGQEDVHETMKQLLVPFVNHATLIGTEKIVTPEDGKPLQLLYDECPSTSAHPPPIECIYIARNKSAAVKNDAPIAGSMDLQGKELISFSLHRGKTAANGHYVTYVKKDGGYWIIDDMNREKTTEETFLNQARHASLLMYNKMRLLAGAAPTPAAVAPLAKEERFSEIGVIGVGDITQRSGTIVNFTNKTLDQDTPIYRAAKVQQELKQKRWDKRNRVTNKQGLFSEGEIVNTAAGDLPAAAIIHVVMPDNLAAAVKKILENSRENGGKVIAFEIPENLKTDDALPVMQQTIATYVAKHQNDLEKFERIEIVLTPAQYAELHPAPVEPPPAPLPPCFTDGQITERPINGFTFITEVTEAPKSSPAPTTKIPKILSSTPTLDQKMKGNFLEIKLNLRNPPELQEYVFDLRPGAAEELDIPGSHVFSYDIPAHESRQALEGFLKNLETCENTFGKRIRVIVPAASDTEEHPSNRIDDAIAAAQAKAAHAAEEAAQKAKQDEKARQELEVQAGLKDYTVNNPPPPSRLWQAWNGIKGLWDDLAENRLGIQPTSQ